MGVRRKAALLVLLTAACGQPVAPQSLPRLAGTTSAPTAVTAASGAAVAGPQSAIAFTRFFFAEITAAFAERDPARVAALSQPGCKTCRLYLASLTQLRDKHQRATPVTFDIRFAEAPATDGGTARVDVQLDVPASTWFDAQGRVVYSERASVGVLQTVELARADGSWKVAEIT